jgi:hypothetical protein
MKNLIEILGGAQRLLGLSFDPDILFEERLTAEHRGFLTFLSLVEEYLPAMKAKQTRLGRPRYDDLPILRSYLAKHIYQIDKNNLLRQRLLSDSSLRRICGFAKVPSEATFSRRLDQFARINLPEATLAALVRQYHQGRLVRVIARDSTSIRAREKAGNKKKSVKVKKYRRGRPRKDEIREPLEPKRVERQLRQSPGKSLSELDKGCGWGCKANSQGKLQYTKGYKLHLDVTDQGIPISLCVTGANVHDSQLSIPLEKMTERRVTHLYVLSDSAYDFPETQLYSTAKGRVVLTDPHNRRNPVKRELGPLEREQYKARTVVERANAHLKDHLLPAALYVKGHCKVSFVLQLGVLCLAAIKILQATANIPDPVV